MIFFCVIIYDLRGKCKIEIVLGLYVGAVLVLVLSLLGIVLEWYFSVNFF